MTNLVKWGLIAAGGYYLWQRYGDHPSVDKALSTMKEFDGVKPLDNYISLEDCGCGCGGSCK